LDSFTTVVESVAKPGALDTQQLLCLDSVAGKKPDWVLSAIVCTVALWLLSSSSSSSSGGQ
jgi:hypothetical protein